MEKIYSEIKNECEIFRCFVWRKDFKKGMATTEQFTLTIAN